MKTPIFYGRSSRAYDEPLAKTKILKQSFAEHTPKLLKILFLFEGHQKKIRMEKILQQMQFAKTVNQSHPTEVRQVGSLEEKSDISGSFGHGTQTVHLGRFLSQILFEAYYTRLSSENKNLKSGNHRVSRIFEVYIRFYGMQIIYS